jgi:hypothetical protein
MALVESARPATAIIHTFFMVTSPFAAKLSGTITGFLDVVAGKFETVHKDRAA